MPWSADSSEPAKGDAKQGAEECAEGEGNGAGEEFGGLFEPEVEAAENHED